MSSTLVLTTPGMSTEAAGGRTGSCEGLGGCAAPPAPIFIMPAFGAPGCGEMEVGGPAFGGLTAGGMAA